jgi:hypothetical protein
MKPWAALSLALFAVGLPLSFFSVMYWFRNEIYADQCLRARNVGSSPATNPNFHVRKRFEELYRWATQCHRVCMMGGHRLSVVYLCCTLAMKCAVGKGGCHLRIGSAYTLPP